MLFRSTTEDRQAAAVVRLESPLFWPNAQGLHDRILDLAAEDRGTAFIVLDLDGTTDLDVTSAQVLAETRDRIARQGITLLVACAHPDVRSALARAGYLAGDDRCFDSVADALTATSP